MAVLQMDKICICALKKDRKRILEFLQRQGCVEINNTQTDDVFAKVDTSSSCSVFGRDAEVAAEAQTILNRYHPGKAPALGFLHGRTSVSVQEHDAFYERMPQVLKTAQRIASLERGITEAKAELARIAAEEEALAPWVKLPVPQTFQGTGQTAVRIGSVQGERSAASLTEQLSEAAPSLGPVHLEIIHSAKEQTCFYLIVEKRDAKLADDALHAIGFIRPAAPAPITPGEQLGQLARRREEARDLIRQSEQEISGYASLREDLRFLEDHMKMRKEKYEALECLAQSKHVFVLTGYVPHENAADLQQKLLDRYGCVVETQSADEDADAPVKLKNSSFAEPTEAILESYSMPGKGELDPVPVMSVFYYAMFGLMLSDAGYGLVMALVCGFALLKFKDMERGWKNNLRLFFWCGLSTVFWGVMLSSYFGDVVNVVSRNFLGQEVGIPPLWFAPLADPMKLLIFCLGIGIVHLVAGYVMKARNLAKHRLYPDIVYDAVFPVLMILGLVAVLMNSKMFEDMAGFRLYLSGAMTNACFGVVLVCVVGVLLTGGRESKSWFKRLLKGLYAVYNVLAGWLGDILSYSRLLALGLATGVIASVINALGAMTGTGVLGAILFAVIFAAGHTMNFGINVLGAYVHSNRLEYVEFFGKFYEGGGRKFTPYGIHTMYYTVKEET